MIDLADIHPPSRRTLALVVLLFFAVTFLVFGRSIGNQFVSWDDDMLITQNPNVQSLSLSNIKTVFTSYDPELYVPLTLVSYQVEHAIAGNVSWIAHTTNLLLHTINALLVTALIFSIFRRLDLSIVVGLLFALHPLNVESVAWASARKDVLSTAFFLLSILAYLRSDERESAGWFIVSIGCFSLALLSKVMVITLPALLVLLEIIRGKTLTRRLAARMIPFVILCVIFGLIAYFGKTQVLVQTSVWQKVLMAALSTSFYLWKFFIPTALSPLYAFNGVIEITVPAFSASLLVCVTLVAGLVAAFKKYPSFVAAILWYLVALSPTFINFAKGGSVFIASDRYAYIAMIGLLIAFGLLLLRCSPDFQKILLRLSTIILVVFAFMSSSQALVWADSETLFSHVLAYYPDTFSARNNLGMEYLNMARTDDAIEEFQKALAIRRDPRTLANLGAAFMQKGDFVSARKAYLEVSDIAPDLPDGFYGLGNLSLKEGKLTEAADWYNKTLVVKPGYWNALNNLAAVSIELRNYTVAIQAFSELIKIKPDFVEAHYNLAIAYEESGQYEKAAREYQTALSFTPEDSDAQLGLARVFSYEKKYTEASKILLGILTADPANEEARALAKKITAAAKR